MASSAKKLTSTPLDSGRDFDRIDLPSEYPALFKTHRSGDVIDAVILNISGTGIGIRSSRAIALQSQLDFIMLGTTIQFRVIWTAPETEGRGHRIGLELIDRRTDLSKTFRWMWERWALEHEV